MENSGKDPRLKFTEGELRILTRRMANEFVRLKRSLKRVYRGYSPSVKSSGFFQRSVEEVCVPNLFCPEDVVNAAFYFNVDPWPNILVGKHAVARTENYRVSRPEKAAADLVEIQLNLLKRHLSCGSCLTSILTDSDENIDPLVRYAISNIQGYEDLKRFWRNSALLFAKLHLDEFYLLESMLPVEFKEELWYGALRCGE